MEKPGIIINDSWLEPFTAQIIRRKESIEKKADELAGNRKLADFATGHLYFGLHRDNDNWLIREWAPAAEEIFLICERNNWKEDESYKFSKSGPESWELKIPCFRLEHREEYKIRIIRDGKSYDRIPAWANYVVQDEISKNFNAAVWQPEEPYIWENDDILPAVSFPLIYEAHVGMATEDHKTGSYIEFRDQVLPRIKKAGYNTIQLMAIQEHPYYGSFGYHVSSFFAPSSRFGTPDDLKSLVDTAHGMGMRVIMDIVHSHAVKNELEGLGNYDGTPYAFFHAGIRREHVAWDSLCFNYGKNQVLHFLLSNIQYWLKVFHFDGFRFDGVTSMLYLDHGLNRDFTEYKMYFDDGQDEEAITYLGLANRLISEIRPDAISVAEEMSGYPGIASPQEEGGIGFTYRMAMGTPDYWIKLIKEKKDEEWNVEEMYWELTRKRQDEKTVGYAESHDQALVGDKTIIFRLIDKEMYYSMSKSSENLVVERGIALHKMIRLLTIATSGNAYLNFMGNEFGHPEWIDFPREGNNWSYQYARRQWKLAEDQMLKYHFLGDFDRDMIEMVKKFNLLSDSVIFRRHSHPGDQVLAIERGSLYFVFNFNPANSFSGYGVSAIPGKYRVVMSSDNNTYGGQGRIDEELSYSSYPEKSVSPNQLLKLYLPARTALVLMRVHVKSIDALLEQGRK